MKLWGAVVAAIESGVGYLYGTLTLRRDPADPHSSCGLQALGPNASRFSTFQKGKLLDWMQKEAKSFQGEHVFEFCPSWWTCPQVFGKNGGEGGPLVSFVAVLPHIPWKPSASQRPLGPGALLLLLALPSICVHKVWAFKRHGALLEARSFSLMSCLMHYSLFFFFSSPNDWTIKPTLSATHMELGV